METIDYTPLYVGTMAMLIFCGVLLYSIYKIFKFKRYAQELELIHTQRYDSLELLIKTDIKTILNILKNHYEKDINVAKEKLL